MQHIRAVQAWQRIQFPVVFLGLCAVAALATNALEPVQVLLSRFFALLVLAAANMAGVPTQLIGGTILSFGEGRFSYDVAPECSGLDVALVYAAGVLAYTSASWRKRLAGLILGTGVILAANFVRLLALAASGVSGPPALFDALHIYGGSTLLFATVGLTWWKWTRWGTHSSESRTPALSRCILPAAVLVALPTLFWITNAWFSAAEHYMHLLLYARAVIAQSLFDATPMLHTEWVHRAAVTYYAPLAGAVGLFMAVPRKAWRARMRMSGVAAAVLFGAQLLTLTADWRLDMVGAQYAPLRVILIALPSALILGLWMGWIRGTRRSAEPAGCGER